MSRDRMQLSTLFWEATLRCNAACPFCGSRCSAVAARPEADAGSVIRAFESVADAYDPSSVMINVTGGEPLLRKDLFTVMDRARQLGFPWGMVTNGSLITDDTICLMKQTGMRTISVSIDGLYEAHERLRRLPGSFSRIVKSIRTLNEVHFLDSIQITTVVTSGNIGELERMLEFFSRLPVDSWRLAIVDPVGRGADHPEALLSPENLKELFGFFERHAFHPKPILTTSCSHYLGGLDSLYRPHPFYCEAGKSVASILADGSIFVCPNVPRREELIQGNILTDDFVSVWENGFGPFREENGRKTGPCARCPDWERCEGDSLHTWDFDHDRPKFCYRQYGLPCPNPGPGLPQRLKARLFSRRNIRISYGSSSSGTVCFSPEAAEELYWFFHWGKAHPANLCEQMAAAAGYSSDGLTWIEELIPVPLQDRDRKTAAFGWELHEYVLKEIGVMNRNLAACGDPSRDADTPLSFLGYIHSHPGELNAVMSLPDLELHALLREKSAGPCFTGIVNPQRRELCIYRDSLFSPADVRLFTGENGVEKWMHGERIRNDTGTL